MENRGFWVTYVLLIFVAGIVAQKITEIDLPATWGWEDLKTYYHAIYSQPVVIQGTPSNVVEQLWVSLIEYFGDFYLLMAFYVFLCSAYLFGAMLFYVCDKLQFFAAYRIQTKRYPSDKDYWECYLNLVQNYGLIIFPLIWVSYPFFKLLDFQSGLPLPSLWTFSWQFIFCMIVEDVSHYFLHRLLHTPWLYKNIHKVHHQFSTPFGLAAAYAHPAEVMILGLCTFMGPLILRSHYIIFYTWTLYRQLDAVATHCGYDFPNIFHLIPYYGGTLPHDYHHKAFLFNYSSRFTFMDKLFGTYKEPVYRKDKEGPIIYSATGLDQMTLSPDHE